MSPGPSGAPSSTATIAPTDLPAATWPARSEADAAAEGRAIEFDASDGVKLAGREFGSGDTVLILSHMGDSENNQSDWFTFAAAIADHGDRAITYNRRGVCPGGNAGCSAGSVDSGLAWEDLQGAIAYAKATGATRLIVGGASFGADTSLLAALDPAIEVQGIVWIAGSLTSSWRSDSLTTADMAAIRTPLLIVSADHDPVAAFVPARVLFDHTTSDKRLVILHSTAHGTDMLEPDGDPVVAGQLLEAILELIERR
jgi:pimeloyl-ACP methyl ester carboxylesterase